MAEKGDLQSGAALMRRGIDGLTVMGGGLIVAMLIQVHFGLRPLRQIRVALARIRAGHANRLETGFPAEIAPLATEINTLLEHNADVVTRARIEGSPTARRLIFVAARR